MVLMRFQNYEASSFWERGRFVHGKREARILSTIKRGEYFGALRGHSRSSVDFAAASLTVAGLSQSDKKSELVKFAATKWFWAKKESRPSRVRTGFKISAWGKVKAFAVVVEAPDAVRALAPNYLDRAVSPADAG
jgi:hypothetical protein